VIASSSEPSATTREGLGRGAAAVVVEFIVVEVRVVEEGREEEVRIRDEVGVGSIGLRVVLSNPRSEKEREKERESKYKIFKMR